MAKRKKNYITFPIVGIFILTLAILLTLFLIKPTFKAENEIILQSSDGRATLTIPSEALPDNADSSELSISPETISRQFSNQLFAAYRISPEGINLSQPAELTLTLDLEKAGLWDQERKNIKLPTIIHSAQDGTIKPLEETKIDIDLAAEKITVSTKIDSFSFISVNTESPLLISFATSQLVDTFNVGESFDVEVNISNNPNQSEKITYSYYSNDGMVVYETFLADDGIIINAGEISTTSYISPREVESFPASATIQPGSKESVVQTTSLTCEDEGPRENAPFREEIEYTVHINGTLIPTKKEIHYEDGRVVEVEMTEQEFKGGLAPMLVSASMEIFCKPNNIDVTMLIHEGQQFPAVQFHSADPDLCKTDHYHPISGSLAYNRQKQAVSDPASKGCGFGPITRTPIEVIQMPRIEAEELSDFLERNGKPPIPIP